MQDNNLIEFYNQKNEEKNIKEDNSKIIEELKNFEYIQTPEEEELYKKFCDIANTDPDQKFKFEHVDKLGVNADFVIIYGKKGIGKTYQISKIIDELAEKDPKAEVILVRNTVSEFEALYNQLRAEYCPLTMKGRTNNVPQLFHKTHLRGGKPRYMGFCVALNGFALEATKGAEYQNTKLIIWDECTNIGAATSYEAKDIARFVTFFDSIIRSKKDVKIYIFGNFHRNTDGKVSDVLLDTLRIPYGCTLKRRSVISKNEQNKTTFLYINTGALYSGIDNNAKVSLFSKEIQDDLFSNMPRSHSSMVGGLNIFYGHIPEWGLIFNEGVETFIVLLSRFERKIDEFKSEINWMLHMEEFPTQNVFVHDIYTSCVTLYNEFSNHNIQLISKRDEQSYIRDLYEICLARSMYYSSDVSRELFRVQMEKWETKHDLGVNANFSNSKVKKWGY